MPYEENRMSPIKNVEHYTIFKHKEHCVNQIATRALKNGDLIAVFNEERFPFHHDSGQTLLTRSTDGGKTWSEPTVVLPWTATQGNWDCGICELEDGTLLVNMTITGFFKRGVKPEQPSWSTHPSAPALNRICVPPSFRSRRGQGSSPAPASCSGRRWRTASTATPV